MKMKKNIMILLFMVVMIMVIPGVAFARDVVVMLDPGHGGWDSGASAGGLQEKDLNWKIATKVKEILDRTEGITGILTRQENECPDLDVRGIKARDNDADLLVSFHINSGSSRASGAEVYITADTTQRRFWEYSNRLGENILGNLREKGVATHIYRPIIKPGKPNEWYSDGVVADYYGIIRNPMYYGIPGMIIEHAYISNGYDRANYLNDAMLNQMAEADANAIIANKEWFRIDRNQNSIGMELKDLQMGTTTSGSPYIWGEFYFNSWINGMIRNTGKLPVVRLVSTDQSKSYEMWTSVREGNLYYFDTLMDPIDPNYDYYIEIESPEKEFIPIYNKGNLMITNRELGKYGKDTIKVEKNQITFETPPYLGDIEANIQRLELQENENGSISMVGEMQVTETIDGIKEIPNRIPNIRLENINQQPIDNFRVEKINQNHYQFSLTTSQIINDRQYVIIVESGNKSNTSNQRVKIANYNKDEVLLKGKRREISMVKNEITVLPIDYSGDIGVGLIGLRLNQNAQGATYLSGNVAVTEWIDGTWNIPDVVPSIKIKTKEGQEVYTCWVSNVRGNEYYFDSYIEGIDPQKEYVIEVKLMNPYNKSRYISANMLTGEQNLGKYDGYNVWIRNEKLKFEIETYYGDIGNEIIDIRLNQNAEGKSYINGNMYITEWINGTEWSIPRKTPSIKIKTKEGQEVYTCWVSNVRGNEYYFDSYIEGIDPQKDYVIEVELTNQGNISTNKKGNGYYGGSKKLGIYKGKEVKIENSIITFGGKDQYRGDIGIQLNGFYANKNEKGETFVSGNVYVTEWVNGTKWSIPKQVPSIKIKTKEGQEVYTCWVSNVSGNEYYFDSYIEGIDTQKEYVIEVELTNTNNISSYKKGNVIFGEKKRLGQYQNKNIVTENQIMKFEMEQYRGDIGQQLIGIYANRNEKGETYISGNLYVTEWINGTEWSIPSEIPSIKIKTKEGKEVYTCWVSNVRGNEYYFDSYIEGIDPQKEYVIEVGLSSKDNISAHKVGQIDFGEEREIGEYQNYVMVLEKTSLKFKTKQMSINQMMIKEEAEEMAKEGNDKKEEQEEEPSKEEMKEEEKEEIPEEEVEVEEEKEIEEETKDEITKEESEEEKEIQEEQKQIEKEESMMTNKHSKEPIE
ncbi:MAG: N-acetylmuramoyl-L-alanine amidase [Clostridia bacterium]|nr:N-acetylmuramoyl-L-alanine amidase [Clostridia bacterium]